VSIEGKWGKALECNFCKATGPIADNDYKAEAAALQDNWERIEEKVHLCPACVDKARQKLL
jgi:hypothetical protein